MVQLWLARPVELDDCFDQLSSHLSADEQQRAAGYKLPKPRRQFVLARGFLRQTLATVLQVAPGSLRFGTTGNEKPVLIDFPSLHFNLSHTASAIAIATSLDHPVGIDVEQIQPRRSLEAIVRQQFHVDEQADYLAAEEPRRLEIFYRIWTCKEAYLKGLGHGFAQPLTSFALRPQGLRYHPMPALDSQAWTVVSKLQWDCALAVAAPGNWSLALAG